LTAEISDPVYPARLAVCYYIRAAIWRLPVKDTVFIAQGCYRARLAHSLAISESRSVSKLKTAKSIVRLFTTPCTKHVHNYGILHGSVD